MKISSVIDISNCSNQKTLRKKIKKLAVDYRTSANSPCIIYVTMTQHAYELISNTDNKIIISIKN